MKVQQPLNLDERRALIADISKNPAKFGRELGFTKLRDGLHDHWIYDMVWTMLETDQTLQAHRGSYKTTCLIVALTLICVIFPNDFTKLIRKTGGDTTSTIQSVQKCLAKDCVQYLALALWGEEVYCTRFNTSQLTTNLYRGSPAEPQIQGFGLQESITGKHATRIFTDDIINTDDRSSRADREKTKLVYAELRNVINPGCHIFNSGTPWHKDDAFTIMPPAEKWDCYATGLLTAEQINLLKHDPAITPTLFAANYELRHITDAGATFTDEQYFSEDEGDEPLMDGNGQIDAAYGGADTTAFTIYKQRGDTTYMFGINWPDSVMNHLGAIADLCKRFRVGTIKCEFNADKGYTARCLNENGMIANTYSETENKHIKITTWGRQLWPAVKWHPETEKEYMRQVLEYQEGVSPDDSPDSYAVCARDVLKRAGGIRATII